MKSRRSLIVEILLWVVGLPTVLALVIGIARWWGGF